MLDKLADKRVAIIGTGATAIQAVPYLGRYAKQLYVIQRTPSTVDERPNPPTDPEWVKTPEARLAEGAAGEFPPRGDGVLQAGRAGPDLRHLDRDQPQPGARNSRPRAGPSSRPSSSWRDAKMVDYQVMERLRRRVEAIVKDPQTAEALKPWYRFLCKRPLSNNDYYPTFNRPNVKLIDVSATKGVERMTEKGFVADGVEYRGRLHDLRQRFRGTSDLERRWGIDVVEGRGGKSIYEHWAGGPKTLHGMMTHGFPNPVLHRIYPGRS